jgi:hypothetical protein
MNNRLCTLCREKFSASFHTGTAEGLGGVSSAYHSYHLLQQVTWIFYALIFNKSKSQYCSEHVREKFQKSFTNMLHIQTQNCENNREQITARTQRQIP